MKLKKIASLALAGIMAVSMLAGCNGATNGNNETPDVTPTNTYTNTVLEKANDVSRLRLSASTNTKLDQAVAYAAGTWEVSEADRNAALGKLVIVNEGATSQVNAAKYMTGSNVVYFDGNAVANLTGTADKTVYILFYTAGTASDEWIANQVADLVDAFVPSLKASDDNATYDYTISVAKANMSVGNSADRSKDSILVGAAISLDYTALNY